MSKLRIRIQNPRPGQAEFTGAERAIEMIAAGQARYVDERTIELLDAEPWKARLRQIAARMEHRPAPVRHSPQLDPIVAFREPAHRVDLVTFLQYPQPGSFRKAA